MRKRVYGEPNQGWTALTLCVFTILVASCGPPAPETGPDKVSVRFPIPIVESGQTTFYVAQDKGFYEEENREVTFEIFFKVPPRRFTM